MEYYIHNHVFVYNHLKLKIIGFSLASNEPFILSSRGYLRLPDYEVIYSVSV